LFLEPTDPAELLAHTAATFSAQAAAQGVCIAVDAPDDLPLLSIDPQRMAQVLANLVSNALRYTPAGGQIMLEASPIDPHSAPARGAAGPETPAVMLAVCDNGQGIGPDELPHIFDRFWRADRSRTRGSGGAGLGLAIVRRIVEAHGGSIEAESAPECGTRFTIRLPAGAVHDVL
jgi:two-component system sensor histidine kinase BaeS